MGREPVPCYCCCLRSKFTHKGTITVGATVCKDEVEISVADTGIG